MSREGYFDRIERERLEFMNKVAELQEELKDAKDWIEALSAQLEADKKRLLETREWNAKLQRENEKLRKRCGEK